MDTNSLIYGISGGVFFLLLIYGGDIIDALKKKNEKDG